MMLRIPLIKQRCATRQEQTPSGQARLWDLFARAVRAAALLPLDAFDAQARLLDGLERYGPTNHLACNLGQEIREEALDIFNLCVLREDAWEVNGGVVDWPALACLKRLVPVLLSLASSLDPPVPPEGK